MSHTIIDTQAGIMSAEIGRKSEIEYELKIKIKKDKELQNFIDENRHGSELLKHFNNDIEKARYCSDECGVGVYSSDEAYMKTLIPFQSHAYTDTARMAEDAKSNGAFFSISACDGMHVFVV